MSYGIKIPSLSQIEDIAKQYLGPDTSIISYNFPDLENGGMRTDWILNLAAEKYSIILFKQSVETTATTLLNIENQLWRIIADRTSEQARKASVKLSKAVGAKVTSENHLDDLFASLRSAVDELEAKYGMPF